VNCGHWQRSVTWETTVLEVAIQNNVTDKNDVVNITGLLQCRHANFSKRDREIYICPRRREGKGMWGCVPPTQLGVLSSPSGVRGGWSTYEPHFFWHISSMKESLWWQEMCYIWRFCKSGISWIVCGMVGICLESGRIPEKAGEGWHICYCNIDEDNQVHGKLNPWHYYSKTLDVRFISWFLHGKTHN